MRNIERLIESHSYSQIMIDDCIKFSGVVIGERNNAEFYIECDADSKTYQRKFNIKEN